MNHKHHPGQASNKQSGAVAIEFALIFPVFFILIYAIAAYSLAFLTVQNFTYASEEVLRAALACEYCESREEWEAKIQTTIEDLGGGIDGNGNAIAPSLIHFADELDPPTISCPPRDGGWVCELSFSASPRLKPINLPGLGPMPSLPDTLVGKASLLM